MFWGGCWAGAGPPPATGPDAAPRRPWGLAPRLAELGALPPGQGATPAEQTDVARPPMPRPRTLCSRSSQDITRVSKECNVGFPNSLRIKWGHQEIFFTSFLNRADAYK